VGCGRVAPKSDLMRLVAAHEDHPAPARAVHDPTGAMPGRGAYLCRGEHPGEPAAACLAEAKRRGAIGRALRCSVTVTSERLESVSR
jgi:predicted RNA-binding protein YlxR (DUF448 family)